MNIAKYQTFALAAIILVAGFIFWKMMQQMNERDYSDLGDVMNK